MSHYHSDHITEDKEARIQERIRVCYAKAYWEQRERYVHLHRMAYASDEHEIYIKACFDEIVQRPSTREDWTAAGFRKSYLEAKDACQSLFGVPDFLAKYGRKARAASNA